jgi:hypothetical protein
VNVVRSFERRLERLLEGVAGRVFSGRLHPAEIAGKLAREADFARFDHETGPATANLYTLLVHPRDLTTDPAELASGLTDELEHYTTEQGLRFEGPCRVEIEASNEVTPGYVVCHVEVLPGPPVVWSRLVGGGDSHEVGRNRNLLGRLATADVMLPHEDVSRRHALLWREGGRVYLQDLGSSNGTVVDGMRIGSDPVEIGPGSLIGFGDHRYRFVGP